MADEDRSFSPNTVGANRTQMQGGGVGQEEMNLQRAPNRGQSATEPDRLTPFDTELEAGTGDDLGRPMGAAEDDDEAAEDLAGPQDVEPSEPRLGVGTQANLDPRDIGEQDNPELDWGEAEPGATFSSNHTRRPIKTEAERGQGRKTRARNKEINSGRT